MRLLCLSAWLSLAPFASSQTLASIAGKIVDPSGTPVPDVAVTLTGQATQAASQATSDNVGAYNITGLQPGTYTIRATKPRFSSYTHTLSIQAGQSVSLSISLPLSAVQQTVVVNGGTQPGATPQPSEADVFVSDQTLRVIDRTQMDMLGPIAGAAQTIGLSPGARVTGYGNTGATKYTLSINGINQGWGGYNGYTGGASLGITFDGIPVVDPATGLWQSATVPQMQIIQDTVVTYGPGDPLHRWYTNVGGAVEFTPLQPGNQAHGDLLLTYGSYNQKNAEFDIASPVYKGWSTILAGGGGQGDDFRHSPDGFGNPSKDLAIYSKTVKTFRQSSLDFGGYYVHSGGYRAQVIPTTPVTGITLNGTPTGALYSQDNSGFYATLPYNNYNKYDVNVMGILHARENIHIDDQTQFQNLTWYTHIRRLHDRLADVFDVGPQTYEWNNPHTDFYGDQASLNRNLPGNNLLSVSGYFIHALYNSRNNFYNPADGGSYNTVNIGGQIRSGYFTQDDGAIALQDVYRPFSSLEITPGIRWVRFSTGYSNNSLQDFNLAPGVMLSSHCPVTLSAISGNAKDQGSSCANTQARDGYEPSISASYRPLNWLTFYGGYLETLRSPSMGGGGGLFQAVDPYTYHLSRARYGQLGFKIYSESTGLFNQLIYGANLYRVAYTSQEIDIGLANGSTISANGAARYQGLNYFLDDNPAPKLHVFLNGNVEGARYTNYVVGNTAYNGSPVPYVPASTFNIGATYDFRLFHKVSIIPVAAYQFVGTQTIFDNSIGAPSNLTMPSYGTMNLGLTSPFKHVDFIVNGLNVLNRKYNEYLYVSSGGYFGTPFGGYELAYPAAPFTIYGSIRFHF